MTCSCGGYFLGFFSFLFFSFIFFSFPEKHQTTGHMIMASIKPSSLARILLLVSNQPPWDESKVVRAIFTSSYGFRSSSFAPLAISSWHKSPPGNTGYYSLPCSKVGLL